MTENSSNSDSKVASERDGEGHRSPRRRKLRFGIAAAALICVGALLGALGTTAVGAHAFAGHGARHGFSSERMMERINRRVSRALDEVGASEEQANQVQSIVSETIEKMGSFREQRRGLRQDLMAEVLAGEINRDRIEQLRQQHLSGHDQMSATAIDGLVRAAEVLTAQQREELKSKGLMARDGKRRFSH